MGVQASAGAQGRARRWLGRLALAVLGPVVVLGGTELGLQVAGVGHPASFFIPAADGRDLVSNPHFGRNFFGEDLARPPLPQRLVRAKPAGVRRVFVLGGSAARGEPDPAFGLARTLAANLALAHPDQTFEIFNTGLTAANSHVVLPVARECLGLDPDLLVVYLGNNEVVGPFGLGPLGGRLPARWLVRLVTGARATRLGQLLARAFGPGGAGAPLRTWGGMAMFVDHAVRAGDPRLAGVREAFGRNLDDLCRAAARAGVPVVLATVAVNTADQPPLLALHAPGFSAADSVACVELLAVAAAALDRGDTDAAGAALDWAMTLDATHAQVRYLRGRRLAALGRHDDARVEFAFACAGDALRFRADAGINDKIRTVAGDQDGAVLVDAAAALAGADHAALFVDHVHFSFAGNLVVGSLLYPAAARSLGLAPAEPATATAVAAWLGHTAYDRWEAAVAVLGITGRPPFAPAQGERDRARAAVLEAEARSLPLATILEAHAAARRLRPDDPFLQEIEARLLQRLGRDDEAIRLWSGLLAWYPHAPDWLVHRAEALLHRGDRPTAIRDLRHAVAIAPKHGTAELRLAGALVAQGETAEALKLLDGLLARMPGDERGARLRELIRSGQSRLER